MSNKQQPVQVYTLTDPQTNRVCYVNRSINANATRIDNPDLAEIIQQLLQEESHG